MLFDVTDKTTISHSFALRYYRFFSKKMLLVPSIRLLTPFESHPSSLAKDFSKFLFVAPYEVAILLGLAGDGVSDGVCLRDCDIIFRIGVL